MTPLYITILAGGLGKRMNSTLPKVLHPVHQKPMIVYTIENSLKLNPKKVLIVVGTYLDIIKRTIGEYIDSPLITYCIQPQAMGTGDAVKSTIPYLKKEEGDRPYHNIILNGDVPMLRYETIRNMYSNYCATGSDLMITAIWVDNPHGFGRVITPCGRLERIVEERDCTPDERLIQVVNCGIYVVNKDVLTKCIPELRPNNVQGEYYLTDIVELWRGQKGVYVLEKEQFVEIYNVNTAEQLQLVNQLMVECVS